MSFVGLITFGYYVQYNMKYIGLQQCLSITYSNFLLGFVIGQTNFYEILFKLYFYLSYFDGYIINNCYK